MECVHTRNTKTNTNSTVQTEQIDQYMATKVPTLETKNNYTNYIQSTETRSQLKTAFYQQKRDRLSSSTLKFAPKIF